MKGFEPSTSTLATRRVVVFAVFFGLLPHAFHCVFYTFHMVYVVEKQKLGRERNKNFIYSGLRIWYDTRTEPGKAMQVVCT